VIYFVFSEKQVVFARKSYLFRDRKLGLLFQATPNYILACAQYSPLEGPFAKTAWIKKRWPTTRRHRKGGAPPPLEDLDK